MGRFANGVIQAGVVLPVELYEQVKALSDRDDRSYSQTMRAAIQRYVDERFADEVPA